MGLKNDIDNFQKEMLPSIPEETLKVMITATEKLIASGLANHARKVGDIAPLFALENSGGTTVALSDLLQQGPLILNFYRGAWCPYCNLELKAWERCMPQLKKMGANLVSITPNLREKSAEFIAENPFTFDILCDQNNQVAKAYGLVFTLPEELHPVYLNFGVNLPEYDGNADYELPIPATYLIGSDGTIMQAFVNADYTQRMEPAEIISFLNSSKYLASIV